MNTTAKTVARNALTEILHACATSSAPILRFRNVVALARIAELSYLLAPSRTNVKADDQSSSTTNHLVGATATPNDARSDTQETVAQGASETNDQSDLSNSNIEVDGPVDPPSHSLSDTSSNSHPVLRLEELIDELDGDDAQEAQTRFDLIKRNLEKGRDIEGLASQLIHIFAPLKKHISEEYDGLSEAKQRVAEEHKRLEKDLAQALQKKKLIDGVFVTPDTIQIKD